MDNVVEALLIEIGGTNIRAKLQGKDLKSEMVIAKTNSFKSLWQVINRFKNLFRLPNSLSSEINIKVAAAGCLHNGRFLSDDIKWLNRSHEELADETQKLGFRLLFIMNDMIATSNGWLAREVARVGCSEVSCPIGIVGIGTGFGVSSIHRISETQFLILSSELGFLPVSPSKTTRIRDVVSGRAINAASVLTKSSINEQTCIDGSITTVDDYWQERNTDPDFLDHFRWSVLAPILSQNLQKIVIVGGAASILRSQGIISPEDLKQNFSNRNIGSIQPMINDVDVSFDSSEDLALFGMTESIGRVSQDFLATKNHSLVVGY
ncbi:glucokinase [Roseibium sp.]|uniref:glucokinase n=1 Tax=Roseibium sp. TaxID=1936156 RepID=UPI003B526CC4